MSRRRHSVRDDSKERAQSEPRPAREAELRITAPWRCLSCRQGIAKPWHSETDFSPLSSTCCVCRLRAHSLTKACPGRLGLRRSFSSSQELTAPPTGWCRWEGRQPSMSANQSYQFFSENTAHRCWFYTPCRLTLAFSHLGINVMYSRGSDQLRMGHSRRCAGCHRVTVWMPLLGAGDAYHGYCECLNALFLRARGPLNTLFWRCAIPKCAVTEVTLYFGQGLRTAQDTVVQ